jgi:hypothetical protein
MAFISLSTVLLHDILGLPIVLIVCGIIFCHIEIFYLPPLQKETKKQYEQQKHKLTPFYHIPKNSVRIIECFYHSFR